MTSASPHPSGAHVLPLSAVRTIRIAVIADQALTAESTLARLRDYPELRLLTPAQQRHADVLLVFADTFTETTMQLLESLDATVSSPGASVVLVTDRVPNLYVLRAVQAGLRGVISRSAPGFDIVVDTIRSVASGAASMPAKLQRQLLDEICVLQGEVLAPLGMTLSGLAVREIEVLRLLAEGLDTSEIARRLSYSERTIKHVISGAITRLGLRNRTQAVAYAIRRGVL